MNAEPMDCGGRDPYNSATTDANWFFALAMRDSERQKRLAALVGAIVKNPKAFANLIFGALGRALRR